MKRKKMAHAQTLCRHATRCPAIHDAARKHEREALMHGSPDTVIKPPTYAPRVPVCPPSMSIHACFTPAPPLLGVAPSVMPEQKTSEARDA